MSRQKGILEEPFSEASSKWAWIKDLWKYCKKDPAPDGTPKSSMEVLTQGRAIYREYQPLVDAGIRSAADFLSSAEGVTHVKALQAALADREPSAIGRELANRIYESPEFRPLRDQLSTVKLKAFGLGASGTLYAVLGAYAGAEYIIGDLNTDLRWWYSAELEILAGIDVGISLSFWTDQEPLTGCIVGGALDYSVWDVALPIKGYNVPFAGKWTFYWQRAELEKKYTFAGFAFQFGLGAVLPKKFPISIGAFMAHQHAAKREPRAKLKVVDSNDSTTIKVATPTELTFTIDFYDKPAVFEQDSTIRFSMPDAFSSDDVSGFTVTAPSNWTYAQNSDTNNFTLTASQQLTYNPGDSIQFTASNAQASGTLNSGDIEDGKVTATAHSTDKFPIALYAPLDVAWDTFAASLDWSASVGTNPDYVLTFTTTSCASTTSCSGTDTPAYSQNTLTPQCLAEATDGTYTYCFGYQYDYSDPGNADNTGQLRAAIWREDLPSRTASTGYYVDPTTTTKETSVTLGSSADGPTITITVDFDS